MLVKTKTYVLIRQADMSIVSEHTGTWEEVSKLRRPGYILADKAKYQGNVVAVPAATSQPVTTQDSGLVVYTDAWTSDNPGVGGYRVVTAKLNPDGKPILIEGIFDQVLVSRDFTETHTNNWYELCGVGAGLRLLNGSGILYTDSQNTIGWISRGRVSDEMRKKDPQYAKELETLISACRELKGNAEIRYIPGEQNPADYLRK